MRHFIELVVVGWIFFLLEATYYKARVLDKTVFNLIVKFEYSGSLKKASKDNVRQHKKSLMQLHTLLTKHKQLAVRICMYLKCRVKNLILVLVSFLMKPQSYQI